MNRRIFAMAAACLGALAFTSPAYAGEPNDTELTATGPMAPGQPLEGAIEVSGDVDYYFFYTPGPSQLTFAISNLSQENGCYYVDVEVLDEEGDYVASGENHERGTMRGFSFAASKAAKYFVKVENDSSCDPADSTPSTYKIDIKPPSSVTTTAPPPPPPPPGPDEDNDGVTQPADCDDTTSSIRPGLPEIVDNLVDENCDGIAAQRTRYASRISLRRKGGRYVGRVVTDAPAGKCVSKRGVKVRRSGRGTKAFGSAKTDANGRFSIKRRRGLRGKRVYVVTTTRTAGLSVCKFARSRKIRG